MYIKRLVGVNDAWSWCVAAALIAGAIPDLAQGVTTTVAVTGQSAGSGVPKGAVFNTFNNPVLNDASQTAYIGFLLFGSGGVDSTNNAGIWRDLTLVAREGFQAPGTPLGAVFRSFNTPVLNNAGQAAHLSFLLNGSGGVDTTNDRGLWLDSTLIAREGSQAPGVPTGAVFNNFNLPVLNNAGQMAYSGTLRTGSGGVDTTNANAIWRDSTLVAREGVQAGGVPTGAVFNTFGSPVLNDVGQIAFEGFLLIGVGGVDTANNNGIWRDSTLVAREGSQAGGTPSGTVFSTFGNPVLNNAGQTAYSATLRIGLGGVDTTNDTGIWRDSTRVAREGSQAGGTPSGAVFRSFSSLLAINDAGQTAYSASLLIGSGGVNSNNDTGIWRDSTRVAREGSQAGGGLPTGAMFSAFNSPVLNNGGQTAYLATLQTGSGGVDSTNNIGIWITGPGGQSLLVAREGNPLAGRTISSVGLLSGSGGSDGKGRSLNNFSQVAYRAIFTGGDQGIFLFTPELHWTRTFSSSWDSSFNWTIRQLPGEPHDVFIDPTVSLTVTGPAGDVAITNLAIGGSNGIATLSLKGGTITSPNTVIVTPTGVLTGDGVVNTNVTNNGTVTADNVTITGTLTNNNIITGSGRINARLNNTTSGEVRVSQGQSLRVSTLAGSHTNAGKIEAIGGEIEFTGLLTNAASTGFITARNATLRFNNGLSNDGSVGISFGTTDVHGDINNTGKITIGGGAQVTFYDDLTQNDTFIVAKVGSTTSVAVLFGDFTGSGGFIGGGDVFILGDLRPGNSPAGVTYDGNLFLSNSTATQIELGGTSPGAEHDQVNVTANVSLNGTLDIALLNGFAPDYLDEFVVVTADSRNGKFDEMNGLFINPDMTLAPAYDYEGNTGLTLIAAIPGDANLDGIVNGLDLLSWQSNLFSGDQWIQGDFNLDGLVSGLDLLIWQSHLFNTVQGLGGGAAAAAASVPEPGSALLLVLGGALLAGKQRSGASTQPKIV